MQRVIIELGDPVVAESIQEILKDLTTPGILKGFSFSVSAPQILAISPGAAVTDDGVLIIEDETKEVAVPTQPGNYTVVYQYTPTNNLGGNPAILSIQPGFFDSDTFEHGVILGWIAYPGGTVIPSSQFISGRRLRLLPPVETQPGYWISEQAPLTTKWIRYSLAGPAPAVVDTYSPIYKALITTVSGMGSINSTAEYYVPFDVPFYGVGKVAVDLQTDGNSMITVSMVNNLGVEYSPLNNAFINTSKARKILDLPVGSSFTEGTVCYVKLRFSLQPGATALVQRVSISSNKEPI
jgi:hypothetical protein